MVSKVTSKTASKTASKSRGKLIYHSIEQMKKKSGENPTDTIEKQVTHSDDVLICKYYEKKNNVATKIIVKSSGTGKDYEYIIKKGNEDQKITKHDKSGILSLLKSNKNLDFMVDYIANAKTLSRTQTKSKNASKTNSPSKSKSKPKPKSKSKNSKSSLKKK
jgi:hypothetical protein